MTAATNATGAKTLRETASQSFDSCKKVLAEIRTRSRCPINGKKKYDFQAEKIADHGHCRRSGQMTGDVDQRIGQAPVQGDPYCWGAALGVSFDKFRGALWKRAGNKRKILRNVQIVDSHFRSVVTPMRSR